MDIRRDVNVNVYALYAKPKPTDRSPIPGELMLNVMSSSVCRCFGWDGISRRRFIPSPKTSHRLCVSVVVA